MYICGNEIFKSNRFHTLKITEKNIDIKFKAEISQLIDIFNVQ